MYYLIEYTTAGGKLYAITHGKTEGYTEVHAILSDTTAHKYKKEDRLMLFEHSNFKILETFNNISDIRTEDWALYAL